MKKMPLSCAVCGLVLSTLVATVAAQTPGPLPPDAAAADNAGQPRFDQPVDLATLDSHRGRLLVHNDMTLTGTTAGNTAEQVNTGSNAISAGAFANMSGIPVVIQNSGANVLIQSAVILNLQMN